MSLGEGCAHLACTGSLCRVCPIPHPPSDVAQFVRERSTPETELAIDDSVSRYETMEARAIRTATSFSTTSPSADATPNSGHGGQRRTGRRRRQSQWHLRQSAARGRSDARSRAEPLGAGPRRGHRQPGGTLSLHAASGSRRPRPDSHRRCTAGLHLALRQAELAGEEPAEVIVLFGDPRYPSGRGTWSLAPPGLTALYEGPGRLLVDQIAEQLRAVVETVQKVALRAARGVPSTDLVWDQSWSVNSPKCPGVMNCARASR